MKRKLPKQERQAVVEKLKLEIECTKKVKDGITFSSNNTNKKIK